MAGRYVTLISAEGFEYVISRAATDISPVVKRMLDPKSRFAEAQSGRCTFPEIRYGRPPPPSLSSPLLASERAVRPSVRSYP